MDETTTRDAIKAAIAHDRERHAPTTDADTWQRLDRMGRWPSDTIGAELNADPRSRFAIFCENLADLRAIGMSRAEAAVTASRLAHVSTLGSAEEIAAFYDEQCRGQS